MAFLAALGGEELAGVAGAEMGGDFFGEMEGSGIASQNLNFFNPNDWTPYEDASGFGDEYAPSHHLKPSAPSMDLMEDLPINDSIGTEIFDEGMANMGSSIEMDGMTQYANMPRSNNSTYDSLSKVQAPPSKSGGGMDFSFLPSARTIQSFLPYVLPTAMERRNNEYRSASLEFKQGALFDFEKEQYHQGLLRHGYKRVNNDPNNGGYEPDESKVHYEFVGSPRGAYSGSSLAGNARSRQFAL